MSSLTNRRILVCVAGGIAAYKTPDIVRRFRKKGAEVRVLLSQSAKQFITALTLQAVSGNPVHEDLFDLEAEAAMGHIELAKWADLILIAPATANVFAKLASGIADDLLTTVVVASNAKKVLAPAMNQQMWLDSQTQNNQLTLSRNGFEMIGPDTGSQACGDVGPGRLSEPEIIVDFCEQQFQSGVLSGLRVLLTAGPTQEPIDPVRYISNHSSGKMGYALAEAAIDAGAKVSLVSGPVNLAQPNRCSFKSVITTREMLAAVEEKLSECDIFIGVAAVSDYRVPTVSAQKIKKKQETINLNLIKNPDILLNVSNSKQRPNFVVGFAAETENLLEHAKAKMHAKALDMIIANRVFSLPGEMEANTTCGFGGDTNSVIILTDKLQKQLSLASKRQIADSIVEEIAKLYYEKNQTKTNSTQNS